MKQGIIKIKFFHSIRGRFILLFAALLLIPTLLFIPVVTFFVNLQFNSLAKEHLNTANIQIESLNRWVNNRSSDINLASSLPDIQSMDKEKVSHTIELLAKQWSFFQNIFVADTDGSRVYDSLGGITNVSGYPYFEQALQGQSYMSNVSISRTSGKATVVFSAPIYNGEKVVGVIAGEVPTDFIQTLMLPLRYGETGDAYLVNSDGLFLTESRFSEGLKRDGKIVVRSTLELKNDSAGVQQAIKGETAVGDYTDYRGHRTLGIYQPIKELGWVLVIEQDYEETFNQVIFILVITTVGILLLLGFISFLVYKVSGSFSEPISLISREAKSLSEGNISASSELKELENLRKRKDEIGVVGRAFMDLAEYLQDIAQTATLVASGNLRIKVQQKSDKDMLGMALVKMIQHLQAIIGDMNRHAEKLAGLSDELIDQESNLNQSINDISLMMEKSSNDTIEQVESLDQMTASVKQMTFAIQGVAKGAQEQASAANVATEISSRINTAIEQVTYNIEAVSLGSQNAANAARDGAKTVEKTIIGMKLIKDKVDLSSKKVQQMGFHSSQIGNILETIDDIASQTNLLALNAAIEAARAGEHGKGFAVVADEVRKLAEKSSDATHEISKLIRDIQQSVNESIEAMEAGANEVESGVNYSEEAGKALQEILKASEAVRQQTEEATMEAQNMHNAANELVTAMESVSAVVEENTAATEEMSANSNEVEMAIERISNLSHEHSESITVSSNSAQKASLQGQTMVGLIESLKQMAGALRDITSKFEI